MSKYLWISLILLEIVCILSQKISGHLTKKTNNNNYDIEDFISQLLSSQKFDELADKVAEKAVKKIQSMSPFEKFSDQKTKHSEVEEIEKEKNNESIEEEGEKKRVIIKINKSGETSQLRQNPHREERPHKADAPVKINTHALFEKDDDSEQGELSLKYEYLKKHAHDEKAHNQQEIASNEPNPWQHLEHSKIQENHRPSEVENHDHRPVNFEKNTNYRMKNKKTNSYSHNVRGRNNNKKEYNEGRPKKDYSSNLRPMFKSEKVPRLPVIDIDENGERKIEEITEEPLVEKSVRNEELLQSEKKEVRKSRRGSVHRSSYPEVQKSNSEELDQNTQDSESNPGYELGELTTTKRVIRQEGNRYYTYLSGPEYAEFHQQLANERKKDGEFN